jgi:cytochrome c oxidase cbb3-type subunit 3
MANPPEPRESPEPEAAKNQEIAGHRYDGIREYDNPMPGWWVWIFWGSIIFSVVYYLGIGVFGFVDTYADDLEQSMAELQRIRDEYNQANPSATVDSAALALAVADPSRVTQGATLFAAQCAACHGPQGQGLIGPNMTDDYYIHGGTNMDAFNVIAEGVVAKGMPPWEAVYTPEELVSLVAYVRSLVGTSPPNPKDPQGELVTQ